MPTEVDRSRAAARVELAVSNSSLYDRGSEGNTGAANRFEHLCLVHGPIRPLRTRLTTLQPGASVRDAMVHFKRLIAGSTLVFAIASIDGCSSSPAAKPTTTVPSVAQAAPAFAAYVKPVDNALLNSLSEGVSASTAVNALTKFDQELTSRTWPSSASAAMQLLVGTLKPLENDFLEADAATNGDLAAEGNAEDDVEMLLGLKQTSTQSVPSTVPTTF